ncbi:hypothetical protein CEE37_13280 [candidate division LCP-89 bacterium B3_LCP]|uniref:Uncharacterized protein n=1 Tax=candidate division LCP-89 bacterium B3_LCP TaxID=2012998 RepID=A0A532USM4_UNCL8|nr:MAG: hypothetical protein CEE37_13280 [candidate division LCP-89 bacterium B3_LCP]
MGFPNVRAAQTKEERDALDIRIRDAYVSVDVRGCKRELDDFGTAIEDSKVVLALNIGVLSALVANDKLQYISFYYQRDSGARIPEDNEFDLGRESVDSLLFTHYHRKINFAALTIDNVGVEYYGDYHITLREETIRKRTSFFEENSLIFCLKHKVIAGTKFPNGYKATWETRSKLAQAKLSSKIEPGTTPSDYPGILIKQGQTGKDDEFIEAHIYGQLNRRTIEQVTTRSKSRRSADRVILKRVRKNLAEIGVIFSEIS